LRGTRWRWGWYSLSCHSLVLDKPPQPVSQY